MASKHALRPHLRSPPQWLVEGGSLSLSLLVFPSFYFSLSLLEFENGDVCLSRSDMKPISCEEVEEAVEDDDTCGGQRWTVVFLVVLVVGVEEGVTG